MTLSLPLALALPGVARDGATARTEPHAHVPTGEALRPYQVEALAAVADLWRAGERRALIVLATGAGKTRTAIEACRGRRVLWVAHRRELLDQATATGRAIGLEVGVVRADLDEVDARLVVASVQTLAVPGRLERVIAAGRPDLIVIDEAHHATTSSYVAVLEALPDADVLGLTATPHRDDGEPLDGWEIAYHYGIADAIRGGWLVRPWVSVARLPDLHLPSLTGRWDYDDAELGAELLRAGVVAHTVEVLGRVHEASALPREGSREVGDLDPRGRAVLVYTATVEQARLTSDALCAAGWRSAWLSGETDGDERAMALADYARGALDVLCSAALLTEGTDLPRCSCVVLARPARSWALYVQMVGRGLRLAPGKAECLLIDLAGASRVHSLIAAPVLLGGRPCPASEDGAHRWTRRDAGGGECGCGVRVSCWPLTEEGPRGAHEWGPDHLCVGCRRAQCVESPTRTHLWVPHSETQRECLHCGCRVSDPLAGLHPDSAPERPDGAREAVWVRVPGVVPELVVAEVEGYGTLYVTREDSGAADVRPWALAHVRWVRPRGRKARTLTRDPVDGAHVRAIADAIVQLAARLEMGSRSRGPTGAQIVRGEQHGVAYRGESQHAHAVRVLTVRARDRALALGFVQRR